MRRFVQIGAVLAMTAATVVSTPALAQDMEGMSDTLIRNLGLPEITVEVGPDGVVAPESLDAGLYVVTLDAADGQIGYLDIIQPPAGLSKEEMTAQALEAGRDDLAKPDWVYVGGTNTPSADGNATFIAELQPGNYQWAASYYSPDQNGEDEVMNLLALTVTAAEDATPVAGAEEPEAAVTLEMTDMLQYVVTPDPVPAGPQLWKLTNTGATQAHHVVMMGVPDGTTAEDILGELNGMFAGTPPAEESIFMQSVPIGYAALQSGSQTTWVEYDLEPGAYAVICFIIDPFTGRPHFMDGMVTAFTAE